VAFLFLLIDNPILCNRIKTILRNLLRLLRTGLINLNTFPLRTFGSHVDRARAKYLGQLATRLYIVLLIIGLTILTLYTIIQPRLITKTFIKPSFDVYNRLIHNNNDTLRCPCSLVSSTYDQYVDIEPIFHQVKTKDHSISCLNKSLELNRMRHYRRCSSLLIHYT
jgi:hypothetical protein